VGRYFSNIVDSVVNHELCDGELRIILGFVKSISKVVLSLPIRPLVSLA
jgi:hypothetical protein